ncbi:MROH1 protein, partial [Nothoprocta ornata]|nr:MROH1 protein [Nothoprocta ornata]
AVPRGRARSAMARHAAARLPPIVKELVPMLSSVLDSQRVTAAAFLAELLGSPALSERLLLEPVVDSVLARQRDPCGAVRVLALRGLGNVAAGAPDKARKHGAKLLAALLHGLDDKDDAHNLVALEAMGGLARLLERVEARDAQAMQLHVAIRIRPFFDSVSAAARGPALRDPTPRVPALHVPALRVPALRVPALCVTAPRVPTPRACKFALRMCGPCMGCAGLCDMFCNHLREERGLHYGEFLNDVCKHLVSAARSLPPVPAVPVVPAPMPSALPQMQSYPETLNRLVCTNMFYFKSSWVDIRAAAPMFIGFLVVHGAEEQCQQVDLDPLLDGEWSR